MTSECLYSGFSDVRYTNCALLESGVVRLDRHASAPVIDVFNNSHRQGPAQSSFPFYSGRWASVRNFSGGGDRSLNPVQPSLDDQDLTVG